MINWLTTKVRVFRIVTGGGRTFEVNVARIWLVLLTIFVFWKMVT